MIDMHTHTSYSDGTDTPIELLKKAQEKRIEYLSITDHNTCKAYDELKKIDVKRYYSGTVINGVELNTKVLGIGIELLGYKVDTDIINKETKGLYHTIEEKNEIEAKELCAICNRLGINLPKSIVSDYYKTRYKYFTSYLLEIIKTDKENKKYFLSDEAWQNDMAFFRKEISNPKSKFYIDETKDIPAIEKVIGIIKKAGGLVFVPHIYIYRENSEKIFEFITNNFEIDGFECYYSKFTDEQSNFLVDYCTKHNLYMSGGSDYHAKTKPDIELGTGRGNLNISSKVIMPWIN